MKIRNAIVAAAKPGIQSPPNSPRNTTMKMAPRIGVVAQFSDGEVRWSRPGQGWSAAAAVPDAELA
jgi:hypothetical protein